jgi:hypothetical protein
MWKDLKELEEKLNYLIKEWCKKFGHDWEYHTQHEEYDTIEYRICNNCGLNESKFEWKKEESPQRGSIYDLSDENIRQYKQKLPDILKNRVEIITLDGELQVILRWKHIEDLMVYMDEF